MTERATSQTDHPAERLQEKILTECPRLGPGDTFRFGCHHGVRCFNKCCADVNIFLSPYDVLRLKRRLGMTSSAFLDQHALLPIQKEMKTPIVLLRMRDDEAKTCPFLTDGGCSVYADRPWPCRMYPIGLAAQRDTADGWRGDHFYFLLREDGCEGFEEPTEWTVRDWLADQGLDDYDEWGEAYKELTLHEFFEQGGTLSPEKLEMFFTATYDIDKFRHFVFGSSLLERFDVDEDFVEEMRYSDEALIRFGFLWLRFSLFGEATMKIKEHVLEAFRGTLDKQALFGRGAQRPTEDAR